MNLQKDNHLMLNKVHLRMKKRKRRRRRRVIKIRIVEARIRGMITITGLHPMTLKSMDRISHKMRRIGSNRRIYKNCDRLIGWLKIFTKYMHLYIFTFILKIFKMI